MTKEPDNPVLMMLREIRLRLDTHEERFDKLDKKHDDMSESLTYSLGFVRRASVRRKLDVLEQRVSRLEKPI